MRIVLLAIILLAFCLAACTGGTHYAPVTEVSTIEPLPHNGVYRVHRDDTLYSISWRYGFDYRYLAKINHVSRPYHIVPGQLIYLRSSPKNVISLLKNRPLSRPRQFLEKEPAGKVSYWHRPARGPLIGIFSELNKGINIGGRLGDAVVATAPGKVVYSGDGLRAYGNLIIIKHNSTFLSAYAHNNKLLVKEGEWIKSGQKIAEMGDTGARRIMLHFEIRREGKPVNPLGYLTRK